MLCQNCNQREGTKHWTGNEGVLAFVRGMYALWCDLCVVRAQLAHAEERAAAIPGLRAEVERLEKRYSEGG